ncbi:MAG: plasmid pRiA4b ORF-3 family protein [Deltaproteobacteria bacterium]|nr:plasmid pRiA4b ORF-3 family protein [Deltaproteobacteria bacterium]MBW2142264.1 plasmid pRiA4b ORF-3 family protein [Deltaproteobacteria bacterium]
METDNSQVYQFKVTLNETRPPIWRRIQVPAEYTFWALHVAIQDAMGWFDSHLHDFKITNLLTGHHERFGIPFEDDMDFGEEPSTKPGWEHYIADYFSLENSKAIYEYDFGDGWEHIVLLEKIIPRDDEKIYPICLDGKRACPPEDCGGVWGYENLLEIIADPNHEDYDTWIEWLGEDFDPEFFDAELIEFDDPAERWKLAFEESDELLQ